MTGIEQADVTPSAGAAYLSFAGLAAPLPFPRTTVPSGFTVAVMTVLGSARAPGTVRVRYRPGLSCTGLSRLPSTRPDARKAVSG
jgi:hypothetical protein